MNSNDFISKFLQYFKSIGLRVSSISEHFYCVAETTCSNLVRQMLKLFIIAETFLFVPPLLIPLIYIIFNTPSPDVWVLPLDIK